MKDQSYNVLLVESDVNTHDAILYYFKNQNYRITSAYDGGMALNIFSKLSDNFDLVICALNLDVVDGIGVLSAIREISEIPVIMIGNSGTDEEQIKCFTKGADDYLPRPLSLLILELRVKVVLKRTYRLRKDWKFKGLFVDFEGRRIFVDEKEVVVTSKEFDLLKFFIKNENVAVSRAKILDDVWGFDYIGDERTVDTIVKQLRSKLTRKYDFIKTVYGIGYRFETDK
ncbi:DNA-binding response regulator, OmpR family, contains REC and winged-helix (wHTH) domain [Acetitomaculum ruminis DSM 5522]|uniref:Stage 0 sporulation protein A homolog n=1 Tax=Acetitomaculum ruminis DSM 5522 TaxID=1120918 RepID=A0A1I0XDU7_9FIRM|nr:response regulator transcription factor [Acetitomaculum ruminis]SFA98606.1 DNA-binding response regulator, OmpR family, contains REC and winged-helix (wHTH) domain [Acetitomaculum ruminis DSM 5522]